VPGQAAQVVVGEVGDQPQPGLNGQGRGAGEQEQLHAHQHPDRVGRIQQPPKTGQDDPAHPQPGEHLDRQSCQAQRLKDLLEGADLGCAPLA
jgi:hypothetical protein